MDPSFRPTIEMIERRDAPVILITVLTPLTLFTATPISFPSYPGPVSITRVPESDAGALPGVPPGTLPELSDETGGVYSAIRISVETGHRPPGR